MVIKVLFVVLILSTATVLAVGIAIFLRVRRHLGGTTEPENVTATETPVSGEDNAHSSEASEELDHGKNSD